MFGVALDLKMSNFKVLFKAPQNLLAGLISQFLVLPALTLTLVLIVEPPASMALGMLLVAACPGGNVSNFFSMMSRGNIALSVSMTTISSLAAVVMTPLNFTFWSGMYPPAAALLQEVNLDTTGIVLTILLVLLIPLLLGMLFNHYRPQLAERYKKPMRQASVGIFSIFVIVAFSSNYEHFILYISEVAGVVFLHNATAISAGFFLAFMVRLPREDQKTISIETGIQNSGLALVLIFDFFNGLGGMAIIAAWWGIWHLISGMIMSYYWSQR